MHTSFHLPRLAMVIGLSLALPIAAATAQTSDTAAVSPTHMAAAQRLVELQNPTACSTVSEGDAQFQQIVNGIAANPDMRELESLFPGFLAHVTREMLPILNEMELVSRTAYMERVGLLLARNMTEPEISEAVSFLASPLGQRIALSMCSNIDLTAITATAANGRDVGADALGSAIRTAAQTTGSEDYSPAEMRQLLAFGRTSASVKLRTLHPQMLQIEAEIGALPMPEFDRRLDEKIEKAMSDYIADHRRTRSK